jgi:hypothetical protein
VTIAAVLANRADDMSGTMTPSVEKLSIGDIIALAAYAGSLAP